uniref:Odorant receptor n=1 Tax=Dendroctonus ponderosae TaxID=77166 RepID=A0AAR5QI27_DENPD
MKDRVKLMHSFKFIMILAGLWRLKLTDNRFYQWLYLLYSMVLQALFTLLTFGSIRNISEAISNRDYTGVIDNIWLSLLTMVILFKMIMFQRKRFLDLILQSIDEESKIYTEETTCIQEIFEHNYKIVKHIILLVCVCVSSSGFSVCVCNTITYFQYRHINQTEMKPMMAPHIQFPLNRHKYFMETYLLSIGTTFGGVIYYTLTQVYFVVVTAFVISQLKIIQRLARDFHLYSNGGDQEKEALTVFRKIYNKHLYIIDFVGELNVLMKYLIFVECTVISIIIASVLFQLIFVPTSLAASTLYIAVSCTVLSQIFVLSWISNEIEVESLSISDALFESRWYEQTQKVKKIIIIIMMRSRKPLRIMIGPFYPLTIHTALNSLRAAYSYVTLIFAMSSSGQLQI